MKKITAVLLFILLFLLVGCSQAQKEDVTVDPLLLQLNVDGEIQANKIKINVSNSTTEYSFVSAFSYSDRYRWELYKDKAGLSGQNIVSKTVDLAVGDNVYYAIFINKENSDDLFLYVIILHREAMYTINVFDGNGSRSFQVKEGTSIKDLRYVVPERQYYTFSGYLFNGVSVTENYVFTRDGEVKLKYELTVYPQQTITDGLLTVGVCADWEPYEYLVGDEYKGIEVEKITAVAATYQLDIRFVDYSFESLLEAVVNNEVDCVIGMMPNEGRATIAIYTQSFCHEEVEDYDTVVFFNKNNADLRDAVDRAITYLNGTGKFEQIERKNR